MWIHCNPWESVTYREKQNELDGTTNPIKEKLYGATGGTYRVLLLWRVCMRVSGGWENAGFEVDDVG